MNFKTKIAYTAVLATLGMAAGSAQAAYLSETGTGQALIYPYYTVQGGYETYITVVNTTSRAKAVKVRILEAKASAEVLDFNLYLSAQDWWGGAISAPADVNKPGNLTTAGKDKSCTDPLGPFVNADFRNYQYLDDGLGNELARTREGYVEIIEMGPIDDATMAANVTHIAGKPKDCNAALGMQPSHIGVPTGGLIGTGTLLNGAKGTDYSYDPVALDDLFISKQFTYAGQTKPHLNDAENVSTVIRRNAANEREVITSTWGATSGIEGVSAVLMHNSVMNEYVLEPTLKGATDWVVTFPTKRAHIGFTVKTSKATPPFTKALTADGACERVSLATYDREEGIGSPTSDFSPPPAPNQQGLCFEANVITFGGANVLSSALTKNTNIAPFGINGWTSLTFADNQQMTNVNNTIVNNSTTPVSATYYGLPAVGFALIGLTNEAVTPGVLSVYGGSFIHKYTNQITLK